MMVAANTHATAGAWIARYHGLKRADESDRTFITTMKVYMEHCACHLPDKPIYWEIAEGLNKCFRARGRAELVVTERCRYSSAASERAGLAAYRAEIEANRPVVLTFCYDPAAAADLSTAKRRTSNCFSVVGIGYMKYGNTDLLICHDGLQYPPASGSGTLDRVSPQSLGINTQGRPWGQTGTTLYKWEGAYKNLVMVFVRD